MGLKEADGWPSSREGAGLNATCAWRQNQLSDKYTNGSLMGFKSWRTRKALSQESLAVGKGGRKREGVRSQETEGWRMDLEHSGPFQGFHQDFCQVRY